MPTLPRPAPPTSRGARCDQGDPAEGGPPVLGEGQPVTGEEVPDEVRLLAVTEGDAKRGILGDPRAPVHHRRELGESPTTGAALALALDVDRHLATVGRLAGAAQIIDSQAVVTA